MKTIKLSLNKFVKGSNNQNNNSHECILKINKIVERCNLITDDLYMFLRAYILYRFENNSNIPQINENLLTCMISVITYKSIKSGRKVTVNNDLVNDLTIFYDRYIKDKHIKKDFTNLSHIFKYTVVSIVTNINNNITLHFEKHIKNFIIFYCKSNNIKFNRKDIQQILFYVFNGKVLNWKDYNKFSINVLVDIIRKNYIPPNLPFAGSHLNYYLKSYPNIFLKYMIKINKEIENYNYNRINLTRFINSLLLLKMNKTIYKTYQWLPRKNSLIPEYIPIDTTIILDILETDNKNYSKKNKDDIDLLWSKHFYYLYEKNNRLENKKYKFNYLIYTDGYGVSILYNNLNNTDNTLKKEKYITDLDNNTLKKLRNKKILGVDPGKRQLVTIVDDKKKKVRYSANQRRVECKYKLKEKRFRKFKSIIITKIESEFSKHNYKTTKLDTYLELLKLKNKYQKQLANHYKSKIYRKYKFTTYVSSQQSEANLVKRIKKKFGNNIVLGYGNWSEKKQMKNYIPTKGIGLRRMLSKYFPVYLVDEFRTSIRCHSCKSKNDYVINRKNPRPYKNNTICVHSLLRCKNVNCSKYWDRDINGAQNIREVAELHIYGLKRPKQLSRSIQQ